MNIKEQVLNLYFIEHKKQKEIAEELNISKYTVSRIVTKDDRYLIEKEERKKQSTINNKKKTLSSDDTAANKSADQKAPVKQESKSIKKNKKNDQAWFL